MNYYPVEYNTIAEDSLFLFNFHSGAWGVMSSTLDASANTLTANTIQFSRFTAARRKITSALPIELIEFTANYRATEKDVLIKWVTSSEVNNDYFTVEKSIDAQNFEELTIVQGAGNSNQVLNYSTLDEKPYNGISYYRLKQTDFNGQFKYSNIVSVNINHGEPIVRVYPNPTQNDLGVNILLT